MTQTGFALIASIMCFMLALTTAAISMKETAVPVPTYEAQVFPSQCWRNQ